MSDTTQSQIKALEWLRLYRSLTQKPINELTTPQKILLKELELKISQFLDPNNAAQNPKRDHLRVNTSLEVQLQDISFKNEDLFRKAYIKNISGGGLFIETNELPSMGAHVKFKLSIEHPPQSLELGGRVTWLNPVPSTVAPKGFGLKFDDMDDEDRRMILGIVNTEAKKLVKKKKK